MLINLDQNDGTPQDVVKALETYEEEHVVTLEESDRLKKVIKSIKEQL